MSNNEKLIAFGFTSKAGSIISNYPLLSVLGLFGLIFIIFLVSGADLDSIGRGIAAIFVLFGSMRVLGQLLMKKWCYKVEIDKANNTLYFHLFFNKGVKLVSIDNIEIIIAGYTYIKKGSQEFILHDAFIHDFVSHLPKNTSIVFIGTIGKHKEKEWNRTGRPLVAGTAALATPVN